MIWKKWYFFFRKLFWPTERMNCFSDREKLLKYEALGRELANFFSITWTIYSNSERSVQTEYFLNFFQEVSQISYYRTIIIQNGKKISGFKNLQEKLENNIEIKVRSKFTKKKPNILTCLYQKDKNRLQPCKK